MIMRDTSPKVVNRRVHRSELMKYMRDNGYLLKEGQIPYYDLRTAKDEFEWK